MHELGAVAAVGHGEVHAERLERRVGLGELGEVGVRRRGAARPGAAERMDPGLHVGSSAQGLDELGDVHPGAAVDLRGYSLVNTSIRTEPKLPSLNWDCPEPSAAASVTT